MERAQRGVIVGAYKRILDAAKVGRGVRLSADEVWTIAWLDDAIRQTVTAWEEDHEDAQETPAHD